MGNRLSRMAVIGVGLASLAACAAPQDFRTRTGAANSTVTAATATPEDVRAEIDFGAAVAARILGRHPLDRDEGLARYIALVGNAVALNDPRGEIQFRFAVLASDTVNAYAAPGGYVFVTRGAIAQMRDEAELAAVLAHEITHVSERHIVRELRIAGRDDDSTAGLARLIGGATEAARAALAQAVDAAVTILFDKGLKQGDEYAADRGGAQHLVATGYDPTALRRYLARVAALKGERVATITGTHPPFAQRVHALDTLGTQLGFETLKYPRVQERFQRYVRRPG